jgi:hypothetical protein
MKTVAKMMAMLFLASFFASSCATIGKLNTEYEEEMTRVEKMTPEQKAAWEKEQDEKAKYDNNMDFYGAGSDND